MKSLFVQIIFLTLSLLSVKAQKGVDTNSKYGVGEHSLRCLKNLTLYDLDYKQKRVLEAYDAWFVAFNECPLSTLNLYTHGVKIVAAKVEAEKDVTKKEEFYQLLMKVYDQRAKYFGNSAKYPVSYIMGLKALDMLAYKGNDALVQQNAYDYLLDNISKAPQTVQPATISSFFSTSITLYKSGALAANKVIENYNIATVLIDKEIAAETKPEKVTVLNGVKSNIDALFLSSGVADCKTLEELFAADFDKKSGDIAWLKSCSAILIKQNCQDSNIFFKIADAQYKLEPSADAAYGLAIMNLKRKDLDGASDFFQKAIEMEQDGTKKSKYLYQLGLIYLNQGNLSGAKSKAVESLQLNPSCGECYLIIGKVYAQSSKTVGANEFEQKSVYWAAVDKFLKAKSVDTSLAEDANQMISAYSALFPTTEELFFQGIAVGASYQVGGIVNETTTVRARK